MDNLFYLQGKIALVTGSSRGLGFVFAEGLAKVKAKVVVNGRNEQIVRKAVEKIKQKGGDVEGYSFDITDSVQVKQNIGFIEEKVGILSKDLFFCLLEITDINLNGILDSFELAQFLRVLLL